MKKKYRFVLAMLTLVSLLMVTACGSTADVSSETETTTTEVTTEDVTEATTEVVSFPVPDVSREPADAGTKENPMNPGDTLNLATDTGDDREVTYVALDADVATVDENGVVTAVTNGVAHFRVDVPNSVPKFLVVYVGAIDEETTESGENSNGETTSGSATGNGGNSGGSSGNNTANFGGNSEGTSGSSNSGSNSGGGVASEPATEATTEAAQEGYFTSDGQAIVDLINNGVLAEMGSYTTPDGVTHTSSVYWDPALEALAKQRCLELVNDFSHNSAGGYNAGLAENCGMGFATSAGEWYNVWYNSPGHKASMSNGGAIGYACYVTPWGQTFAVYLRRQN